MRHLVCEEVFPEDFLQETPFPGHFYKALSLHRDDTDTRVLDSTWLHPHNLSNVTNISDVSENVNFHLSCLFLAKQVSPPVKKLSLRVWIFTEIILVTENRALYSMMTSSLLCICRLPTTYVCGGNLHM